MNNYRHLLQFLETALQSDGAARLAARMVFGMQLLQTRLGNMRIYLRGGNIGVA